MAGWDFAPNPGGGVDGAEKFGMNAEPAGAPPGASDCSRPSPEARGAPRSETLGNPVATGVTDFGSALELAPGALPSKALNCELRSACGPKAPWIPAPAPVAAPAESGALMNSRN